MTPTVIRSTLLAAAATALLAAGAHAGPPWISVEYPANPHANATRGALFVVHAYHHGDPAAYPVAARAEGIVDGKRRSVPAQITRMEGARYAVRWEAPAKGSWLVVVDLEMGGDAGASALVGVRRGEVGAVRVPTTREDRWIVPRRATRADIDAALRVQVAADAAADSGRSARAGFAAPLALALLATAVLRRRRTRASE